MARLILFDKRGTGLSDPVPVSELPSLDQRLDDVRAVMDAAGSERAVLLGVSEGGPLCSLFAATYPEKTEALVMIGSYARRLWDHDYPWGPTRDERDRFCQHDHRRVGRAGRHRRTRAVDGPRSGVPRLVGGVPADGREPGRRGRADADERRDRHSRRAAVDPRPDARRPSHRRSPAQGGGGTLPGVTHSRRDAGRAAGRRSPALRRRSGRDARRDRTVPVGHARTREPRTARSHRCSPSRPMRRQATWRTSSRCSRAK